jgi:hypothetical protein
MDKIEKTEKTVIAWDVGIKNLAYCVMKLNTDGTFSVDKAKWNKINLMEEEDKKDFKCTHVATVTKKRKKLPDLVTEKVCTKDAKCYYMKDDIKYGLCGTHKNNYTEQLDGKNTDIDDNFVEVKKSKDVVCQYTIGNDNKSCNKSALWKANDCTFYCTAHKKTTINNLKKKNKLQADKKQSCMHVNLFILGQSLYSKLNEIKEIILNVDEVIIENQPTFINPTMKTMSALIYGYFVMAITNEKNKYPIKNVRFYAPSNKLKIQTTDDKKPEKKELKNKTSQNAYKQKKLLSNIANI